MKSYNANDIRNIAIAGHGGRGKTTLAEAMLFLAGAADRLGRVADGNTVMDFDPEEKKRTSSVSTAVAPLEWKNTKINLLDTPGKFDYAGGLYEGVRAAESVLVVTAAGSGFDVGAEKAIKAADSRGVAKFFAVTRTDAENADFYKTFEVLKEGIGSKLCPVVVPYMVDGAVKAYVNLASGKAFEYKNGKAAEVAMPSDAHISEMRDILMETAASADEELMEKFFEEMELSLEDVNKGLSIGVKSGDIYPVFACSGYTTDAVDMLLDAIVASAPAASTIKEGDIECSADGEAAAVCFKTVADPFVGKMSYIKVIRGKISADSPVMNARTEEQQRFGKIITVRGGKQEDAGMIGAGDIGVITKLEGVKTGDTLCSVKAPVTLEGVDFPKPCLSMAVKVKKKGEEEKVAAGLNKLMEEDPTITFAVNTETREQILSGLGEQHIDVIVSKLKAKFNVEVDLAVPRVAYREAIRKTVSVQGRHKKQSGGHGQFGDVWIRFEPHEGDDLIFESEVVGGSVPKNFFPAVEKGLRECIQKGVIAGYPMVGLKAVLYDGSYHPVDSSEMAFKTAASLAFKAAIPQAGPVILEPIGTLTVLVPDDNMGDMMSDITKRRGSVLGMGPANEPKMQQLDAEVPMAEMGDFATVLRSVTAGRGSFSMEFARYQDAPATVMQKVIEESKALAEEE
ncbi:MAG: elongation factor G [Clostridia bacterium]|nr:elongation factor G [Clostridia bacterium]